VPETTRSNYTIHDLIDADIEFIIDKCVRSTIGNGIPASQWLSERNGDVNLERLSKGLRRLKHAAFLHFFIDQLAVESRARVHQHGWDPHNLPELPSDTDDAEAVLDMLALGVLETALEEGGPQRVEDGRRRQELERRHRRKLPDGLIPGTEEAVQAAEVTATKAVAATQAAKGAGRQLEYGDRHDLTRR
jgi:hypothetical protein